MTVLQKVYFEEQTRCLLAEQHAPLHSSRFLFISSAPPAPPANTPIDLPFQSITLSSSVSIAAQSLATPAMDTTPSVVAAYK